MRNSKLRVTVEGDGGEGIGLGRLRILIRCLIKMSLYVGEDVRHDVFVFDVINRKIKATWQDNW